MDPLSFDHPNSDDESNAEQAKGSAQDETHEVPRQASSSSDSDPPLQQSHEIPEKFGRFTILRRLGGGYHAEVYLAHDSDLDRQVTLKIPRLERLRSKTDLQRYIAEARNIAKLNHRAIVAVYDVQTTNDGTLLLVLEHIDGRDLAEAMQTERFSTLRAVEMMIEVAGAASYAHEKGIIHRDLKPANIVLDKEVKPHIADFGLAVRAQEQRGRPGQVAGTPPYMSPEQIRGETHRLDGRTDVWSMGVILYELLAGQRPFSGETADELFHEIQHREAKPPRQTKQKLPTELERICLKCLCKRMSDRYASASDLATDLRLWRKKRLSQRRRHSQASSATSASSSSPETVDTNSSGALAAPVQVVPKGLRTFDADDSEFFLELLPGPVDRDRLPESIRFWKTRIEHIEPEDTFSVGLLYGPSGCGKSSIVKAGLIPRLAEHVQPIYLEATAEETPKRLARRLRAACPDLSPDDSLVDLMIAIREQATSLVGKKVVIFLDQFEQWLHANPASVGDEMLQALRQCDGTHLQCVLLVRDDFGMSAMRFMNALEVPVVEGQNYATVDLFDEEHAVNVLAHLGRAFGRLPEDGSLSTEQTRFLHAAVRDLGEDGRVVCVHLALFAEMFRWKTWNLESLRKAGGAQGIGIAFLDDTLSSSTSNPRRRMHRHAARRVLKALLPEHEADMRGRMLSYDELLRQSGYASRPDQFADLVEILDTELRLITPTEHPHDDKGEESETLVRKQENGLRRYQLTHDYLVSPLREWLTRKQRDTRRGRAQLLLEDRAATWTRRPERRYLPSLIETLRIQLLTRVPDWTPTQAKMMQTATRGHAVTVALTVVLLAVVGMIVWSAQSRAQEDRIAGKVDSLVSQLLKAEIAHVPGILKKLELSEGLWQEKLKAIAHDPERDYEERLRAYLMLVRGGSTDTAFLVERLLAATPDELVVIRDELRSHEKTVGPTLWEKVTDSQSTGDELVRAACALAHIDVPTDVLRWKKKEGDVSRALVRQDTRLVGEWARQLSPVRELLQKPLTDIFRGGGAEGGDQIVAAIALSVLLRDDAEALGGLLVDANESQYPILFDAFARHGPEAKSWLHDELAKLASTQPESVSEEGIRRKAMVAVTLARLDEPTDLWSLMQRTPDPRLTATLIHQLAPHGVNPQRLLARLDHEQDATVRQALVLALGEYVISNMPPKIKSQAIKKCAELFRTDTSGAVHSAAEWTLRQWGEKELVEKSTNELRGQSVGDWNVNSQGLTMLTVHPSPQSPDSPSLRPFVISAHEVTVAQYQDFYSDAQYAEDVAQSLSCPMNDVSCYAAARYCRWLSEEEDIPDSQMFYPPNDEIKPGLQLKTEHLRRTGYRLPTKAEWLAACQAGMVTTRFFGDTEELLGKYALHSYNIGKRVHPVGTLKPNWFGLFDIYGNVAEWCQPDPGTALGEVGCDVGGGNYRQPAQNAASMMSDRFVPRGRLSFVGFRIVRSMEP